MQVVGICRFSLVGRGDWKAYQGKTDDDGPRAADQVENLFLPERMEARLATFTHLTLASIRAQTDPDFTFLVLASDLMPQEYRQRLDALCADVPQVVVSYFPIISTALAQEAAMKDLGLSYGETLQFRLDDDDCVCTDFIEVLKRYASPMMKGPRPFVASLRGVMFSSLHGPATGVYNWPVAFFSAGAAMHHPRSSIFAFGHFGMARRFPSLIIPNRMALVTHAGNNDTSILTAAVTRRRGMTKMSDAQVAKAQQTFFPFLSERALSISGLNTERSNA